MKIVQVTTASAVGGVLTHVLDLSEALQARGHEVVVAVPAGAWRPHQLAEARGLTVVDLDSAVRRRADVWHLHSHSTFDRLTLGVNLRRRRRSPALVLTEHLPRAAVSDPSIPWDPDSQGRPRPGAAQAKTLVKRAQVRSCAAVIVVANSSKDFMVRRYRLEADRIRVVHNGVRPPSRHSTPGTDPTRPLRVVAIGTLGWRKGFDVLVEASALAAQPWTVDVIGEGSLRPDLEAQAVRCGGRVRFLGFRADAAEAIHDYDVLCLPTRGEAFPYVTLEAMVRGRPVVASRVDGIAEVVQDGVNGLLVPPEDPSSLAVALDALAGDRAMCTQLGTRAHHDIDRGFTLEQMVDRTLDVYEQTARPRERRRRWVWRAGMRP